MNYDNKYQQNNMIRSGPFLAMIICHSDYDDDAANKICKFVIEKCLKQAAPLLPPAQLIKAI